MLGKYKYCSCLLQQQQDAYRKSLIINLNFSLGLFTVSPIPFCGDFYFFIILCSYMCVLGHKRMFLPVSFSPEYLLCLFDFANLFQSKYLCSLLWLIWMYISTCNSAFDSFFDIDWRSQGFCEIFFLYGFFNSKKSWTMELEFSFLVSNC